MPVCSIVKLLPLGAVDDQMHYCIRSSTAPRGNSFDYTSNKHEITVYYHLPYFNSCHAAYLNEPLPSLIVPVYLQHFKCFMDFQSKRKSLYRELSHLFKSDFFVHVCLLMPCGHPLGKGWPLGSRL